MKSVSKDNSVPRLAESRRCPQNLLPWSFQQYVTWCLSFRQFFGRGQFGPRHSPYYSPVQRQTNHERRHDHRHRSGQPPYSPPPPALRFARSFRCGQHPRTKFRWRFRPLRHERQQCV